MATNRRSFSDEQFWRSEKEPSYTPPRRQPLALDALGTVRKRFAAPVVPMAYPRQVGECQHERIAVSGETRRCVQCGEGQS